MLQAYHDFGFYQYKFTCAAFVIFQLLASSVMLVNVTFMWNRAASETKPREYASVTHSHSELHVGPRVVAFIGAMEDLVATELTSIFHHMKQGRNALVRL